MYQASGSLGPHVLKALIDAGFQVKVLTRSKKPGAFDASVNVVEVDFVSIESLTAALKGVDAVVSTVAGTAIDGQTVLIDAAVAAGVKRFIPSEYGSVTTNPQVKQIPVYTPMFNIKRYLSEKASSGKLTWTVLACGAFTEFLFMAGILDFADRKAVLLDDGDNRFSTTSLPSIGKAIAGILRNVDATKNKVVKVSEAILTQNKLLKIAQKLEPDAKWETSKVQSSTLLKEGLDGLGAGDFSYPVILKIIKSTALGGDMYGSAYDETDNKLLGVKELTEEALTKLVAEKLT